MSYQALYRAWRPERFSDVVGQEAIVATLTNQVRTGRVAHAYLFCGSRGTGKTSMSKILARAINCLEPSDGCEPCGRCAACVALAGESSMDVIEIDAASNNGVDEIRELRDKVRYPPSVGRYKVYIIDEVHMLSAGAFNALLKTLEEPPAHAVFILATTEPQRLPATILSRCQRYDFRRISAAAIVGRLRQVLDSTGARAESGALEMIARAAEGGMRDALSILDMCLAASPESLSTEDVRCALGASDRSFLFDFCAAVLRGDAGTALRGIDQLIREGRDAAVFAREVTSHVRALMLAQLTGDALEELLEITAEDAQRYQEQARGLPSERLTRVMDLFMRAESDMRWASQPRSVLELCAVRACHPEREQSIEALEERVSALEKRGPVAAAPADEDAPPFDVARKPRAEKPKKPAAAPSQKAAASVSPDQQVWETALKQLEADQKSVYPLVKDAKFAGIQEGVATLELSRARAFYQAILEKEDKRTLIEQALTQAAGRPLKLRVTRASEAPARPAASSPQTLATAYDVFGRENVSVLDDN